jgi:hypothetical protein
MFHKSKCFKALIIMTASFSLVQAQQINKKTLFIPQRLGNISLRHDDNGFSIENNSKLFPVQPCFMDKELRGISADKLARLIATGAYLSVNNIGESNEYSLKLSSRLNGGGIGGATAGFYIRSNSFSNNRVS